MSLRLHSYMLHNAAAIEQAPRRWRREAPRNSISTQRCAVADLLVRLAAAARGAARLSARLEVARAEEVLCGNNFMKRGASTLVRPHQRRQGGAPSR